jgi:hypothetical protein
MADQPGIGPAPLPTITVTLHPRPAGPDGAYFFEASLEITHMPGGFRGAHHGLCLALEKVAAQLGEEAKREGVVKLATRLPDGNGLVR